MDALSTLAGAPLDSEDKCESALSVHKRLQQYQERWDAVVLQMETQSKKVTHMFCNHLCIINYIFNTNIVIFK